MHMSRVISRRSTHSSCEPPCCSSRVSTPAGSASTQAYCHIEFLVISLHIFSSSLVSRVFHRAQLCAGRSSHANFTSVLSLHKYGRSFRTQLIPFRSSYLPCPVVLAHEATHTAIESRIAHRGVSFVCVGFGRRRGAIFVGSPASCLRDTSLSSVSSGFMPVTGEG